ncbi:MAG: hypothetical protein IT341_02745 [Chloroflexi bacterium]|nr:hypothetical protein [Chloroflexota bacterium]
MTPDLQRQIEQWFIGRGVPQLVDGYTAERRMDARAVPLIGAWLVLGTVLDWGTRPDWPVALNALGVLGVLAFIGLSIVAIVRIRGSSVLGRELPPYLIVTVAAIVGVADAVVDGAWGEGVAAALGSLTGIGVIYVVVGLGLLEIAWWGLRRLWTELGQIVGLLSTTLPVLLILVMFLLFSAEIWEAAGMLATVEFWAALALIWIVAVLLIVNAIGSELATLEASDPAALRELAASTPAASITEAPLDTPPPLTTLQRFNLAVLAVIGQLLQSLFVAALVTAFLVAFGMIVVPGELQERWASVPISPIVEIVLLGDARVLSIELLIVTALLGAIVGLYFTGLAVTDTAYRPAHFGRIVDELRALVAARSIYAQALASGADSGAEALPYPDR